MSDLAGLKAMVLEDEASIALLIEDMLETLGCEVVMSIARMERALQLAPGVQCDFAVLDINLNGTPVFPVAEVLRSRSIPFVFSTGYGAAGVPAEFSDVPVLGKPFPIEELERGIARALSAQRA